MNTSSFPARKQGEPGTVVFILSTTRSGSTWLSYVLGSHSQAAHLGEYYRPFTFKNHVACRLCEARGRGECEVLYGIHQIDPGLAYDFAFSRLNARFLIDCSKNLAWLSRFVGQDRFRVKVIHLIREPRGWFASEKRRATMTAAGGMELWLKANIAIADFIKHYRLSFVTAFYDEVASQQEKYLPPVCDFVGISFETRMLRYWEFEHHGLGGNGAAYNVIGGYQAARITTGDETYYRMNAKKQFYDTRWRSQLSRDEVNVIENTPAVKHLLGIHGRDFAHFNRLAGAAESESGGTGTA